MQLLSNISDVLAGRKAAAGTTDDLSLAPAQGSIWERFGLSRSTRFRYTSDSLLEAYRAHELVYACVNKIADVMNDAELVVEAVNGKGEWDVVKGHQLIALFKRPNPNETGRDFRRLMVQAEQAAGIFYAEIKRSRAGNPVEIYPLNPNRIEPILNAAQNGIGAYRFTRADGRFYDIAPENMIIRRRVDLINRFYGLSPLDVALKSINSDLGMTDYIDAFFESDGTPSGILKILNTTLSDTKKESLISQWQKKFSRSGSNYKGVAVLDQNAEYQKIGANLDELAAEGISDRFESRICAVFGVPPILVGSLVGLKYTTTNATAKAALRDFWDNKINGELSTLREWLTWFVLPLFEDIEKVQTEKIRVNWDVTHVAFLQEDADGLHKRARENFKAGLIRLNEAREQIGMPPDETAKDDYYVQPAALIAISGENRQLEAAGEPVEQPEPLQPVAAQEEDTEGPKAALGGETIPDETTETTLEKKTYDYDGMMLGREPQGIELVIDLKAIADGYQTEKDKIAQILLAFRNKLIDQAAQELDNLDPKDAYTLTLSPDASAQNRIRKALQSAYRRGRRQIIDELNAQRAAKALAPLETKDDSEDADFLEELIDLITSKILSEIQTRAINVYTSLRLLLDYSVDKLKQLLSDESTKFIEQIAGNYANVAVRTGRDAEIENNLDEINYCEYSAILDQNTCNPCEEADGQTAATPGDLPDAPNPDCEGGANCRCFIVGVIV